MPTVDPDIHVFTESVGASLPDPEAEGYRTFKRLFKRANYFIHPQGFLIVKISRSKKPFWGVGKKQIDALNDLLDNYFLVLLDSPRTGYVINKKEVNRHIQNRTWGLATDDNYKINAMPPSRFLFRSPEQFIEKVKGPV